MSKTVIGGNRLGSGKKMSVEMQGYERSTHDLSYIWRSTQSPGTLVPFMCEVGLPGDTFDIDLNCVGMTHPTVGPLFGSYKYQLDIFEIPIALYNAQMIINANKIGLNMANVKLPQVVLKASTKNKGEDNTQVNPSSIFAYLGVRGLGRPATVQGTGMISRAFNATAWLGYWDIYKNFYANQQEGKGAVIHQDVFPNPSVTSVVINYPGGNTTIPKNGTTNFGSIRANQITITFQAGGWNADALKQNILFIDDQQNTLSFDQVIADAIASTSTTWTLKSVPTALTITGWTFRNETSLPIAPTTPKVTLFDLDNIDAMRMSILAAGKNQLVIGNGTAGEKAPYTLPLQNDAVNQFSIQQSQEGLALKTYQNDMFNNWMATEWISNINSMTQVSTAGDAFSIDALRLASKVNNMLLRIAMSGGTYKDWVDTTYDEETWSMPNTPIYCGGLSKELVFQEVVANSAATTSQGDQVLGQLAGRGTMTNKHKGGHVVVKVRQHSVIMGIVSITPRIDYSQGNRWDVNLKTMDDFHKPALDQIGFQDLITDQMAYWDSVIQNNNEWYVAPTFKSAGKQPAWINYMTNYNRTFGNFAVKSNEMFMTLNRRYEQNNDGSIKDLTSYIDPIKYNFIFAETAIDAQNFWTQISIDIIARRKMSAKVMPNL